MTLTCTCTADMDGQLESMIVHSQKQLPHTGTHWNKLDSIDLKAVKTHPSSLRYNC